MHLAGNYRGRWHGGHGKTGFGPHFFMGTWEPDHSGRISGAKITCG